MRSVNVFIYVLASENYSFRRCFYYMRLSLKCNELFISTFITSFSSIDFLVTKFKTCLFTIKSSVHGNPLATPYWNVESYFSTCFQFDVLFISNSRSTCVYNVDLKNNESIWILLEHLLLFHSERQLTCRETSTHTVKTVLDLWGCLFRSEGLLQSTNRIHMQFVCLVYRNDNDFLFYFSWYCLIVFSSK